MTLALCAASGLTLLLLLAARSALNDLSPVALGKLSEEQPGPGGLLARFLDRKPSFLLTLQLGIMGATAILVMSVEHLFRDGDAAGGLDLRGVLAGLIAAGVILALAQLLAALEPRQTLFVTLPFLRLCGWVLAPVTVPLGAVVQALLDAWERRQGQESEEDKEEEIAALIGVGEREGILEGEDSVLIEGVLSFGDTVVREVMTPRTDMVCAEAGTALKSGVELLARTRHTRLPLYEGQVDNIVGVVYVKELLGPLLEGDGGAPLKRFMRPVPFVPENKPISQLLREFQQQKVQLAIVVDEYGGVDGVVTSEDLLEEIVGEIQESDEAEEAPLKTTGAGQVEALGRASIYDLAEALGVDFEEGDYDTVAGWVITALGSIPHAGDRTTIEGLQVEVLQADKKRIHRVRVTRSAPGAPPAGAEGPQEAP